VDLFLKGGLSVPIKPKYMGTDLKVYHTSSNYRLHTVMRIVWFVIASLATKSCKCNN